MWNASKNSGWRRRIGAGMAAAALLAAAMPSTLAASAVTKHSEMAAELKADCAKAPDALHLFTIGAAASSRKPIYLVRVTAEAPGATPADSPRILVICRQHGDEPVNTEAALHWLAGCAALPSPELRKRLGASTIYLIPMANPDGADRLSRFTGTSGDMNRDWGVFRLPETRAIYAASKQIAPTAVIDMHSWDLTDPFQANSVEAGLVSAGKGSQQPGAAIDLQNSVIRSIRQTTGQQVSALGYSPEADPRLCHRFFAAQGIPAILTETAAGPSDSRAQMASRVQYALAALTGAVQTAPTAVWQRQVAPNSVFLASADALARRSIATIPTAAVSRASTAQLASARRKAIRLSLALYLAACVVLAVVGGRTLAFAWRRLLRIGPAPVAQGYLSIRARRYPPQLRESTERLLAASRPAPIRCR